MQTRRDFLKMLGIGSAVAVVPELIAEPVRRIWQVPSNAPVGSRIERARPIHNPDFVEGADGWRRELMAELAELSRHNLDRFEGIEIGGWRFEYVEDREIVNDASVTLDLERARLRTYVTIRVDDVNC